MPQSNAQSLTEVYDKCNSIADDVSAIPKYVGGQAGAGGAGRTASGLAMLMGNASKILQTVSANIDRDVMEPALLQLADLIMLTDTTGILTGEERISVQGVNVAIQRETLRQRQIEFLSATINPTDQKIVGLKGRAAILRAVASTIGLDGEEIVPPEQVMEKMEQQEQAQAQSGPIDAKVQEGVMKGVEAGVQRISTELTAGVLAARAQMPEGPPTHIGTPEGAPPGPGGGAAPQGTGGPMTPSAAAMGPASGAKQGPQVAGGMAPQTSVVGNQPGAGAFPISPGVG